MKIKLRRAAVMAAICASLGCPVAFATLQDYQQAVTNQASLISYYNFDRTNASDSIGGNNGTAAGTVNFVEGIGSAGRAIGLNGAGRINLGQVPAFDFSDGTGSVEAWVRPGWAGTFSAYNPCIFADRNGGPVTWSVHMNGDKSGVGVWNGFSYLPLGIPAPGTNWHHLVVTFDNSSATALVTIYWDGVLVDARNQDLGPGSTPTQIGSSASGANDEGWVGSLDEVAFYADALSSNAVQSHFQALFLGTPPIITRQPSGGTFLPGVNLQLNLAATGPNLTYQWSKNGNPIQGATDATLTLTNLSAGDAATYRVVVSNPAGNVPSSDIVVALDSTFPPRVSAYQAAVTNEASLISYYPFDRLTTTDLRALHDGALQGNANFGQGIGGGPDQGLRLDGAGHVSLGSVSDFDFADTTGSVEAWIRADWSGIGYNPCIFSDRNGGPVTWSVHMNADKKAIGVWNGLAYQTIPIPDAGTNWHHLAVVFDSGNVTMYWDGIFVGTMTEALGVAPATIQLGSSSDSPTAEGWVGMLDEVAFYADPLPASSVQTHYAAFFGTSAPTITVQPVGGAFYSGHAWQLTVWASGAGLSYQWFKNSTAVPDATNWFLGFAALTPGDAGSYYATVSNSTAVAVSASAVLQVGNNISNYQAAVRSEPTLISYYTFDAGDATDSEGTNNGTPTGTAAFDLGVGQGTDKALILDGPSDVEFGDVPAFQFTNGVGSVEAWLRPDWSNDPGYDPCLFACRNGGPTDWSIHMLRTRGGMGNWNGSHFQSFGLSDTAGWHHYAVVFNSGQLTMYWDGQSLGEFAQAINLGTDLPTQLGSSASGGAAEGWIGAIDEVAFYGSALDASAIQNHFLAMVGASRPPALSVARVNNTITLNWPANASGFVLEYSDTLPAVSWTAVPGMVTNSATLTITNDHRFYRLRK